MIAAEDLFRYNLDTVVTAGSLLFLRSIKLKQPTKQKSRYAKAQRVHYSHSSLLVLGTLLCWIKAARDHHHFLQLNIKSNIYHHHHQSWIEAAWFLNQVFFSSSSQSSEIICLSKPGRVEQQMARRFPCREQNPESPPPSTAPRTLPCPIPAKKLIVKRPSGNYWDCLQLFASSAILHDRVSDKLFNSPDFA